MINPIPVEGAHLVGTFFGLATYGVYIFLTGHALVHVKRGRIRSRVITVVLTMVWICTTVAIGIKILTTYVAFVARSKTTGPRAFYGKEYMQGYSASYKFVAYLNGAFADCLMCWRMYVVWNRNKSVLVVPLSLLLFLVGSMSAAFVYEIKNSMAHGAYAVLERRWQLIALALTLTVNNVVTALICWRIWRVAIVVTGNTPGSDQLYRHLIHVMVESGVLYTVALVAFFIARAAKFDTSAIIITYLIPPLTGIMPTLVILRLFSNPEATTRTTSHRESTMSQPESGENTIAPRDAYSENTLPFEDLSQSNNELDSQQKDVQSSIRQRRPEGVDPTDVSDIRLSLVNCDPIS